MRIGLDALRRPQRGGSLHWSGAPEGEATVGDEGAEGAVADGGGDEVDGAGGSSAGAREHWTSATNPKVSPARTT